MTDRHLLGLLKIGAVRGAVLVALSSLAVAACGGGTSDMGGSGGANTGGSGNDTGGSGNDTGGSGNDTGGSGNDTGGADSGTGGNDANGGDGGMGGEDGGNGEDCPATIPDTEDSCEGGFNAPTCTYGDQECSCQGFGPNATWDCAEAGSNECPAEAPTDGDDCTATDEPCEYEGVTCTCPDFGQNPTWNCGETLECPTDQPTDGDECTGTGFCNYDDGNCICAGDEWNCF
jgi:hypothetical protein